MNNFTIMGVQNQFLGGRGHEKLIYRGNCLKKRGAWTVWRGRCWFFLSEEGGLKKMSRS